MTTIQFDRLNDVVKATELLPLGGFRMDTVNHCGTAGCMIGNYNAMKGRTANCYADYRTQDWHHFGLSLSEYCWLFGSGVHRQSSEGFFFNAYDIATAWEHHVDGFRRVPASEAIARLRKFIAYKRRKHALIHDDKYGVSDAARRAEGNQLFAVLAVRDAMAEMPLATAN